MSVAINQKWVTAALAALVLVTCAALVWVVAQTPPTYKRAAYDTEQGSYSVGSIPEGSEPVQAAVATAQHALGYDYRRMDQGLEKATSRMTKSFADDFRTTFDTVVRTDAQRKQSVVVALVKAAGLASRDGQHAECLVFVDQIVVNNQSGDKGQAPPNVLQSRVKVELEQVDGAWLATSIDPV